MLLVFESSHGGGAKKKVPSRIFSPLSLRFFLRAHISTPVFRILSLYFFSLRLPSSSMSSVGMLLGSLAALAHPGLPPQGASAPAVSGIRGGDAAGALGQNPLARYDFGNSSFDLSALSMPSSWWRVKVRRRARARARRRRRHAQPVATRARAPISPARRTSPTTAPTR
jgi:hypothetical protein